MSDVKRRIPEALRAEPAFLYGLVTATDDTNYTVVRITPSRIVAHPIGGGPKAQVWEP